MVHSHAHIGHAHFTHGNFKARKKLRGDFGSFGFRIYGHADICAHLVSPS